MADGGFAFDTVWPALDKKLTAAVYFSIIAVLILMATIVYIPIDIWHKITGKCLDNESCCRKRKNSNEEIPLADPSIKRESGTKANPADYAAF